MQISTNVQQTTEVVALMPAAPTLQVAPRVPVYLDTTEMESLVPVNKCCNFCHKGAIAQS